MFGGSFDPIHVGHLIAASEALRQLSLDVVLFLPARQPPHKPGQKLADDHHRCAMIELAIAGRPEFQLSGIDLQFDGPSYSADLVERISRSLPDQELFFIIGGDSMRDFHTWYEPHRIAELTTIVVARRSNAPYDLEDVVAQTPTLEGRIKEVQMPLIDISSTTIRQRVSVGEHFWYQVPLDVERYIELHGLYR